MTHYKVLLVDDEKQILDGMEQGIDWKAAGYEVAGTAANGLEAWEMIQTLKPDVVISDIRMPFMDGLALAKKISEQLTKIRIVLFSGFDDFDYAKQAIHYQVYDYMLKPVRPAELSELLKRMHKELDAEVKNAQDTEYLRQVYQENLPLMKAQFFFSLVEGRLDEARIEEKLSEYRITFSDNYYAAVVVQTDWQPGGQGDEDDEIRDLYISRLVQKMLEKIGSCISFQYYGKLVFLCSYAQEHQIHTLIQYLDEAVGRGKRFYHTDVYSGIGRGYKKRSMLSKSFSEAQEALEFSTVFPNAPVNYIKDIEPQRQDSSELSFEGMKNSQGLLDAVKSGAEERIIAEIDRHYEKAGLETVNLNLYQNYILELFFSLQGIVYQYKLSGDKRLSDARSSLQQVMSLQTGEQLRGWLRDYCIYLSRAIKNSRTNTNQQLAREAKEYIDENYANPQISVEQLCEYLHVSSSHFSSTFSRENGITFIGYLTERRLQEAERLLQTTDYKTREISEMVGYTEPNYFSYVFKKNRQVSPANYRKRFRQETQG